MTFPKGKKNPNAGRKAGSKDSYRRAYIKKASGLRKLKRLLDGYIDDALIVAGEIMVDKNGAARDKLAAAKLFLEKYASIEMDIARAEHIINKPIDAGMVSEAELSGEAPSGSNVSVLSMGIVQNRASEDED